MDNILSLIKRYAIQPSTYQGLLKVLYGLGIHTLSPTVESSVVTFLVHLAGAVIDAAGVYDVVRNEHKTPTV